MSLLSNASRTSQRLLGLQVFATIACSTLRTLPVFVQQMPYAHSLECMPHTKLQNHVLHEHGSSYSVGSIHHHACFRLQGETAGIHSPVQRLQGETARRVGIHWHRVSSCWRQDFEINRLRHVIQTFGAWLSVHCLSRVWVA